jgi:ABC-2 type transport system permease protein
VKGAAGRYGAYASLAAREALAYRAFLGMQLVASAVSMAVLGYFWRAVFATHGEVAGLDRATALRYVLLAQVVSGAAETWILRRTSLALREGRIAVDLTRPVDLQLAQLAHAAGTWAVTLATRLPLVALAVALGAELRGDPLAWAAGLASFGIGACAMFGFEWALASLAFRTTEVWGIQVTVEALAVFFGGALVPLDVLPPALRAVAAVLPFQQVVHVPVSLLAGSIPLADAPRVLAVQLAWAAALLLGSRLLFDRAARAVTIHGG